MNPAKIILGLVPFALFSLLATAIPTGWAALVGLAAAIVALLADLRGGVKAVPLVAVLTMGVFALLAFVADPGAAWLFGAYGRGLATLVLALYVLATATTAPFTAAYARETTPREYWGSPTFVDVNQRISLAWGVTLLVMAGGHLVADGIVASGASAPVVVAALNWALPIMAIVRTVKFSRSAAAGSATPQEA